jgi:glycosyltransferase involved in cell wall biosynthesis
MRTDRVEVCHVITRLDLGGAQENTLYTVRHLGEPFRASLVCGPGGMLDEEVRGDSRIDSVFVPGLVRPIRPWSDAAGLLGLREVFRKKRPAIVHTHSSKAGVLGRIAARLAGVPIVVHSIHGFGFNDRQPEPLRAGLVLLERAVAPLTTHFIAVSRANLGQGAALGIIPRGRGSLIRSGIAIEPFVRAARERGQCGAAALRRQIGMPGEGPLVGMVACLKPQKAPLDFVEVARRVAHEVPQARFLIAGDGPLRPAIEARARAVGLEGRLHLLGWRRDLPRVMAALDVLVLTSLWEGLPRVIPEGIAAGVPVVATAVDGTADILVDGENGMVCRPGDVAGLAVRVVALLRDPVLGSRLAGRALGLLAEFDIDRMVRAQEELYLDLLRESGRGLEARESLRRAAGA